MKRKTKARLAILGLATAMAFTGPAFAQDASFYLGGSIGQAEAEGVCDDLQTIVTGIGTVSSCDEKDSAWKLFGGYQFNRHFAIEASYFDYGSVSASGQTFGVPFRITGDATAFGLAAVGILPIANHFSLFGKLGLLRTEVDVTGSGAGGERNYLTSQPMGPLRSGNSAAPCWVESGRITAS